MAATSFSPGADTVLTGARVRTLDPAQPWATAVAISGDRILTVGDDSDIRHWRGDRTNIVDLRGATLTPGLVDSHSHPIWGIDLAGGIDLSECRDLDSLRAILAEAARQAEPGAWVTGFGLDHNVFAGRPITNTLIDDVATGIPVFLRLYDAHSALASSDALKAAGITGPRTFHQHAAVVCDEHGHPTGHLIEHAAVDLVTKVMPRPSVAEQRTRLLALLNDMAATGLTGAHVMDLQVPGTLDMLTGIEDEGHLPLRLRLSPWCMPGAGQDELGHLVELQQRRGRQWEVAGVKFFMDGTVEGGTAWLESPDCHGKCTDAFWPDPAEYTRTMHTLARAGIPTATHAIGDAAIRHVLDSIETLGTAHIPGVHRHRIEHIETVPDDQLHRFAKLGVIASMQPPHVGFTRADHTDEWSRRLGDHRAHNAWRCRDLQDAGATLALGTDWPIAHYDARQLLATAQLRRPPHQHSTLPVAPEQALTGLEALEGCTTHAAYAAGVEALAGRIAPGHRADMTALAVDPAEAPPDELADTEITLTMSGGRITHRSRTVG